MPVIPRVLDVITCKISDLPLDLICSTYIYIHNYIIIHVLDRIYFTATSMARIG